jgi:hypothetical protein
MAPTIAQGRDDEGLEALILRLQLPPAEAAALRQQGLGSMELLRDLPGRPMAGPR